MKLNRIQIKYSAAEIEDFIEAHMEDGIMDIQNVENMDEETFEKLILAYDYSTKKNSKYRVLEEEELEMIENGRYRYPDLKFIPRKS